MSRDTLEQEPCEMTAEEYRQRMIQAFHNADTDELIAICVLPTEKEFEHLEWLLKNHYKKEPCEDAISRQAVCNIVDAIRDCISVEGYWAILERLKKLPSVNPQPCEDAIDRAEAIKIASGYCHPANVAKELAKLPPVTPQPKTGHCKDCKYFEYDSVAKVDGIPLIVAHEICKRWGDGCKTKEDGYCFMFEPQERSDKE